MRALLIAAALLLLATGTGGYWYLTAKIEAPPAPAAVLAAEQALSLPAAVGLLHVDLAHAVEVEEAFRGEADREALLAPVTGSGSLVELLLEGGFDPRRTVDHLVGALVVDDNGLGTVGIATGRFSGERLSGLLAERYDVEEARLADRPVHLISSFDADSCEVIGPYALHITPERLVLGDPELVGTVLRRLEDGTVSAVDLTAWRAYREGKVLSVGLLHGLQELANRTPDPVVWMVVQGVPALLEPIDRVYAGVAFQALPPRLLLGTQIVTDDATWALDAANAYSAWAEQANAEFAQQMPALTSLTDYLTVTAEGGHLIAEAALGNDFLDDAAEVPGEAIRLAFSELGGISVGAGSPRPAAEEELEPAERIMAYRASLAHEALPAFDAELNHAFDPLAVSGPFGLRVDTFRLAEVEGQELIEIVVETKSGEIPNMTLESLHGVKGNARARMVVTAVRDAADGDLLRHERCGPDRNELPGDLEASSHSRFVNDSFVPIPVVRGQKALRLVPEAQVADIAAISGYIDLRLPTRVETRRVEAPFENKVVELPGLRIKLGRSEPGAIAYEISGNSDRVLAVRGLNKDGAQLRDDGSSASDRLLSAGKTVNKSFTGTPVAVEFVVAAEETEQRYPFEIAPVAPRFDRWDLPGPFRVAATSGTLFRRDSAGLDLSSACEGRPADSQVAPFQLCPQSFRAGWGGFSAQFEVFGPQSPALLGNLSALELRLDSVDAGKDETSHEPLGLGRFVNLRQAYGSDHLEDTPWVQGDLPEALEDKTIRAVQGRLVARLPLELDHLSLPVGELGSQASHGNGLKVRLVGFQSGSLQLEVSGPRERLVQFVPRDAEGQALAVNNTRLDADDETGQWRASLSVSGRPTSLDIVFAAAQEVLEYPFDMPIEDQ